MPAARARTLVVVGGCLCGLAALLLILPTSGSILGSSVSCGTGFAYLLGGDKHADAITMAVCQPALSRYITYAAIVGLAGAITFSIGVGSIHRPAPLPPPGWYPSPSDPRWVEWWDGHRWSGHRHDR